MKFQFVNVLTNHRGNEREQLMAGAEFSKVWQTLTGKRNASLPQLDALKSLIAEARANGGGVEIIH